MRKDEISLASLVEIYNGTSYDQICNSEQTTKNGHKVVNYYLASYTTWNGCENMYQLSITTNPELGEDGVVNVVLNIHHLVPGRGKTSDRLFLNTNSRDTVFGELFFHVPVKGWDCMRNGVLTAVLDYVDSHIENKIAA